MNYLPGGLPSLAHPLIGNAVLGSRNSKGSICRPPFPEIDLSWDGFTLSYFHWLGIKDTDYDPHWQFGLFIRHELSHDRLGITPFSLVSWHGMRLFHELIYKTFKNGKKSRQTIPVPLRSAQARNVLDEKWGRIVHTCHDMFKFIIDTTIITKDSDEYDLNAKEFDEGYPNVNWKYNQGTKFKILIEIINKETIELEKVFIKSQQ